MVEGLLSTNVMDFLLLMLFFRQRAIFVCPQHQFHTQILFLALLLLFFFLFPMHCKPNNRLFAAFFLLIYDGTMIYCSK